MTKATKKTETRLGLYVTDKKDGEFYTINASIVTIGYNQWERDAITRGEQISAKSPETIRNAGDDPVNGLYLDSLQASCQGDTVSTPRRLYGFDLRYRDVYAVDVYKAERMASTLKTITKRMDKMVEQFGQPATFGQYLARVAKAIKADTFVREVPQPGRRYSSYSDNQHRLMDISTGIYNVDQMADTWIRFDELQKEAANA